MKRSLLLGAVSALAMIASAQAADLGGMKEPPAAPPIWNWSGFYVGVNGGYIWDQGGVSALDQEYVDWWNYSDRHQATLDGGFGGGQIGYNIQRDRLVYGVEVDIQGASLSASRNANPWDGYATPFSSANAEANLDWFGSVRGRLGLVPWGNILVYITGGWAFGGFTDNMRHTYDWGYYNNNNNSNDVRSGYDLGAGVEWGVSPAWSLKVEYQFFDLGSVDVRHYWADGYGDWTSAQSEAKLSFNTVRVGINYHFLPEYVPLK
jgi:outer membrane immunogenic protein